MGDSSLWIIDSWRTSFSFANKKICTVLQGRSVEEGEMIWTDPGETRTPIKSKFPNPCLTIQLLIRKHLCTFYSNHYGNCHNCDILYGLWSIHEKTKIISQIGEIQKNKTKTRPPIWHILTFMRDDRML